jgi:hypothetical protein
MKELEQRLARAQHLKDVNLGDPYLLLSHFILGGEAVTRFAAGRPLNTDDRPRIEFSAPRLAQRARSLGVENLAALSRETGDVGAFLGAGWPDDPARGDRMSAAVRAKTTVIEGIRLAAEGRPAEAFEASRRALEADPVNDDLLVSHDRLWGMVEPR